MKKLVFLPLLAVLFAFACGPAEKPAEPAPAPAAPPAPAEEPVAPEGPTAEAVLHNAEGEEIGVAVFVQAKSAVLLSAEVGGVERPGLHGFHVHEVGECVPPFTSAGGHFNPKGVEHACPGTPIRHAGDFGNIEIAGGAGKIEDLPSDLVTVTPGDTSIVGRAVILHEGEDNCIAQPTGDAGSRLACGVIKMRVFDAEDMDAEAGAGDGGDAGAEG